MYKSLFENAPVSLWKEDYSEIIKLLNELSEGDRDNLKLYFSEHPLELEKYKSAMRIVDVNQESLLLFEANSKEELIKQARQVFTESSSQTFISELMNLVQGIHTYDFKTEVMTAKGNLRYVNLRIHINQNGDGTPAYDNIIVAISDLTESRLSEIAVRDEKLRTQHYLNLANVLFAAFDTSGRIIMINTRLHKLLDMRESDIIGKLWIKNFVPEDEQKKIQNTFQRLLDGKQVGHKPIEGHILLPRGERHVVEWFFDVLLDEDGEILEIVASGIDVTRERALEYKNIEMQAKLQQSQKLNSISVLARGVAHEINNPLTGLLNYANILEEEVTDPELRDFAQGIQKEGTRVAKIVSNLLTFARLETANKRVASVKDVIDNATMLIKQSLLTDNIQFEVGEIHSEYMSFCQVQEIQQVILNILTNSWNAVNLKQFDDFTDQKISVQVSLINIDKAEYIRIQVEDNGVGIKQADLDSVFDPFFTVHSPIRHAGMGLAVAYGIIADHDGKISIQSDYGKGTTVFIDLLRHNGDESSNFEAL